MIDGPIVRVVTVHRNGNVSEGDLGDGKDRWVIAVRIRTSTLGVDKAEIETYPRGDMPEWWSHWIHKAALDKKVFELGLRDYQTMVK